MTWIAAWINFLELAQDYSVVPEALNNGSLLFIDRNDGDLNSARGEIN
jgi:hypothetical protein